eukprot:3341593-Ditylum_brightwellii.AAC.1
MEEKKEDKPVMVDKGTDSKKVSMEMEGTMTDAVEFADGKVSDVMEVSKEQGAFPLVWQRGASSPNK